MKKKEKAKWKKIDELKMMMEKKKKKRSWKKT